MQDAVPPGTASEKSRTLEETRIHCQLASLCCSPKKHLLGQNPASPSWRPNNPKPLWIIELCEATLRFLRRFWRLADVGNNLKRTYLQQSGSVLPIL